MQNELAYFKEQAKPNKAQDEFLGKVTETLRTEKSALEDKLARIEKFDLPFNLE